MSRTKKVISTIVQGIGDVDFSMMPVGPHTIIIRDTIYMDDNLDASDDGFILMDNRTSPEDPFHLMMSIAVLCREGSFTANLDGKEYIVKENDFLMIKPGTIFQGMTFSTDVTCRLAVYAISIGGMIGTSQIPQTSTMAFVKLVVNSGNVVLLHLDKEVSDIYVSLYRIQRSAFMYVEQEYLTDAITNFMSSIATIIASFLKKSPQGSLYEEQLDRKKALFHQFIAEIHGNVYSERGVSFYAEKFFMSSKYFSGVITEVSGHNPTHWIKQAVVLEAKALLSSGKYTIQQVSDKMNFANPSFFCKYFKSVEHMSPGEFAKSIRK